MTAAGEFPGCAAAAPHALQPSCCFRMKQSPESGALLQSCMCCGPAAAFRQDEARASCCSRRSAAAE